MRIDNIVAVMLAMALHNGCMSTSTGIGTETETENGTQSFTDFTVGCMYAIVEPNQ